MNTYQSSTTVGEGLLRIHEPENSSAIVTIQDGTTEEQTDGTKQFTTTSESIVRTVPDRQNTLPPETSSKRSETSRAPTTTTVPLPANRCRHPLDSGNCVGRFDRWYWDGEKRICESFIYSGCGGNGLFCFEHTCIHAYITYSFFSGNNFGSREECLSICHISAQPGNRNISVSNLYLVKQDTTTPDLEILDVCDSPIDSGDCKGSFKRYGYDRESDQCTKFIYSGCGGNGLFAF